MVLAVASMASCTPTDAIDTVKDTTSDVFNTVKKTVGGWFGIEFEEENDNNNNADNAGNNNQGGTTTPDNKTDAQYAVTQINSLYKNLDAKTTANYDLLAKVSIKGGEAVLPIVWTTNNTAVTIVPKEGDENKVTVVLPEAPEADVNYTLTATVTDSKGNTESVSFNRYVPSVNTYTTLAEYYAAAKGDTVIVKGIVSAIISKSASGGSKNHIYLNDESGKGGYYIYALEKDPVSELGLAVGMTVKVTGEKDIYKNAHEVKNSTVEILDNTIKTVTPVDITSVYANAEAVNDKALDAYQGLLVTIQGVELTYLETASSGFLYYHFSLDGVESYMGVSHSKDNCMSDADTQALIAKFDANKGSTATITGIAASFDGNFYIVPNSKDSLSGFQAVERTDAQKVQYELDSLEVVENVKIDTVIDLVTAGKIYNNVVINWSSDNTCAVVENGKLTITIQDTKQVVTLTASAAIGDMTPVTKTFTIAVDAKPSYVINTVTNPVADTAYKLHLFHATKGENMFLTGKFDSTYNYNLGTTGTLSQAADFYLVAVEGGKYNLKVIVDGITKYVNLAASGTYCNITIDMDPITAYTFDTENNTLTATLTHGDASKTWYFGTYATNAKTGVTTSETYRITGSNAANVGVSQFVLHLVTITDTSTMTDSDKIAAEAGKLNIDTKVTEDTEITLPTATVNGVTILWSVTDNATITDGKLVITLGDEAKTVVLTAAITAGSTTANKTFTFEVPKKSNKVLTPMYTFEEGVAYKIVGKNSNGYVYFSGSISSGRITGDPSITKGVDVYVKFVDKNAGTFLLYFMDGNTVKYIDSYVNNSTKTAGFKIVTESELSDATWSLNEDNAIVSSANGRAISTQTTSTYTTFSTYALSNLGTAGYFTSYLAAFVEETTVTDAEKVAAESNKVKVEVTEVSNDFTLTLPTPSVYANDVTFTWTVAGDCAVITDGKLVITLPAANTKVTLTLVIACGDAKETKTFEINVTVSPLTFNKVTAPVVDKAYKFYLTQAQKGYDIFFAGSMSGNYYAVTKNLADAVDVYLEATEGGYHLYMKNADGTKTYLDMNAYDYNNNKVGVRMVTEAQVAAGETLCVYTFIEEYGTIVSVVPTAKYQNTYYFGTYDANEYIRCNSTYYITGDNASKVGVSQYIAYLAEVECTHEFTDECDTTCDYCGFFRTGVTVNHTYTDECDTACDKCGETREAPHKYVSDCDTTCDCGATREVNASHEYDNDCDDACNLCSETRVAPHNYVSDCDTTCSCGVTRETTVNHTPADACATVCTLCGEAVTPTHKYASDCDTTCDCGVTRETTVNHSTDDACETACDLCGEAVTPTHKYVSDCDTTCDCGATRETTADHVYGAGCDDTACDNCGATREPIDHSYPHDCSTDCNNMNCDETRDAVDCKDADGDGYCDYGCGKEITAGGDVPAVPV